MLNKPIYNVVVSKNVFCQAMVVLLHVNPVCMLLSGMLYVYKSELCVAVFRSDDLQNTGFDLAIENCRIVWTLIFEAAGSKAEGSILYNYRFHIVACYNKFSI